LKAQRENLESYVLKINRISFRNQNINSLLQTAKKEKEEYEEIKEIYKDMPDLIPNEEYIIINGLKNNKIAVAMLQPYQDENLRDIFQIQENDMLLSLIQKNKNLREQVKKFTDISLSRDDIVGREIDILGRNNLAIVGNEGEERLILLDPHFRAESGRSQKTQEKIRNRLKDLKRLADEIEQS